MKNFFRNFLGRVFKGQISKSLNRKLKQLKFPQPLPEDMQGNVGVLQLKYRQAEGLNFVDLIFPIMNYAHQKRVELLFFPGGLQYVFFPPFKNSPKYIKYFTENLLEDFIKIISRLAIGFGISVFTGELYIYEDGRIFRYGMIVDRSGKIHTVYRKLNGELEITSPFKYKNLRFAFLSTEEASMYEFSKLSVMQGANVLVNCSVGNISVHKYHAFRGIWSRCQQFKVYGINATIVGETPWGYSNLPSGLYGPTELFKEGIIATAKNLSETELVSGRFDLERISSPIPQQNSLIKFMKTLKL